MYMKIKLLATLTTQRKCIFSVYFQISCCEEFKAFMLMKGHSVIQLSHMLKITRDSFQKMLFLTSVSTMYIPVFSKKW